MIIKYILCAVIAYLIGSISTGVLLSKPKGQDIRTQGSKNSGATNALRVMGLKIGLLTFIGDCVKAIIAVLLGKWIGGEYGALLAGLFVVLGHNWPVFFNFKGGKGISCSCAVMVILFPLQGLIACAICALIIYLTKYVSLGSMAMLTVFALMLLFIKPFFPYGIWAILIAALGIYRHKANIGRLLSGTENKTTFKKK